MVARGNVTTGCHFGRTGSKTSPFAEEKPSAIENELSISELNACTSRSPPECDPGSELGWEAGSPGNRSSSVCGFSRLVAQRRVFCQLNRNTVCVCWRPSAGCLRFCRLDVSRCHSLRSSLVCSCLPSRRSAMDGHQGGSDAVRVNPDVLTAASARAAARRNATQINARTAGTPVILTRREC
jgi:hypothetical protein